MNSYTVTWEIDIDADTPQEAAKMAREIMEDEASEAQFFDVRDVETGEIFPVDLNQE